MITSVVREYKWPPEVIGGLFFDAEDYQGLIYWYDDLVEVHAEMKKAQQKK